MKKQLFVLGMLILAVSTAFAGTTTSTMAVSATVTADCVINSVGAMAFGSQGIPFTINNVNASATSVINYTCTNTGVAPSIRLGQGLNAASGSTDAAPLRRMVSNGNYISYALYQDSAHTTPWNNTSATGVAGTANGSAQNVTAYGVATAANVPSGSYSDTVIVSIDF